MERKGDEMTELTELEYSVLGAVYFVEPYDHILEECDASEKIVRDALRALIQRRYITAMKFDETAGEYVRSFIYDADDMRAFRYMATKDGLMAHNSR